MRGDAHTAAVLERLAPTSPVNDSGKSGSPALSDESGLDSGDLSLSGARSVSGSLPPAARVRSATTRSRLAGVAGRLGRDGRVDDSDNGDGSVSTNDSSDDNNGRYILPEDLLTESSSDEDGDTVPSVSATATPRDTEGVPPHSMPPCTSIFNTAQELYGYLLLRGAKPLREEQYAMVREGFKSTSSLPLPSLTSVRERLALGVVPWMLPTTAFELPTKVGNVKVNVQCILPSAHVRRDVAFAPTFRKLFEAEERTAEERALHPDFIDSPFFTRRSDILETGRTMHRFTMDGVRVSVGDSLTVVLRPPLAPRRVTATSAFIASHRSGLAKSSNVHAGDLVVICEGDGGDEVSGSLVARHWMASVLQPLSWAPDSSSGACHDVLEVQIRARRDADGGGEDPVDTSVGQAATPWRPKRGVKDGVPFSTVSIALNSDDFEARRGKNESLGGVYLSYVSMLYKDRCSSNACRTIAATPPTVDSDEVLRALTPDLKEGATTGWLCRRPDGSPMRVFVDVAFFVGDYLQVCKTSMTMGYGAKSPCPLCSYRIPGVPGSRYGLPGSSADTDMTRTTSRTRSICRAVREAAGDAAS